MTDEHSPVRLWSDLTTLDAEAFAAGDAVVVLPLAAIEQHGPHLPLSTDLVIEEGILRAAFNVLDPATPVASLPVQAVGTSAEHERFGGTVSLSPETLVSLICEIGASLARAGVRRLVVSNSHGGNRASIDTAGLWLRRKLGMLVVKAHSFRFPPPADTPLPDSEWTHGLHGGAVETSMMLHLRPDLVRADRIASFASFGQELEKTLTHVRPEGPAPFAWSAEDLGRAGVVGDATLADAGIGARLVSHYGRYLAEVIQDAHRFPIERLRHDDEADQAAPGAP
ncbi:MAG: creatininase family protein [Gemmatimonadota bacterium]|nr:creatininase family protein [Gemmatimonadota bacterium]